MIAESIDRLHELPLLWIDKVNGTLVCALDVDIAEFHTDRLGLLAKSRNNHRILFRDVVPFLNVLGKIEQPLFSENYKALFLTWLL